MRFLVTGGTGFLGNNLVRALVDRGESVRALSRSGQIEKPLQCLAVECVRGDVSDPSSLQSAMHGVECVIHAAGWVHIGRDGLDEARRVNVQGAKHVARAAREAGARLVHVSSVDALGISTRERCADENWAAAQPLQTPYVVSKREGDAEVLDEIGRGLNGVLVYPGFMLGPWDWKPSSGRMLLEIVQRFAIVAPRGGHSMCDVRDVCDGILSAAEKGRRGEKYILAGHNLTFFDTWRMFARIAGTRGPVWRIGPIVQLVGCKIADAGNALRKREGDFNSTAIQLASQYHYFASDKAQRELGYHIRPSEETVRDALQWFRTHGYVK